MNKFDDETQNRKLYRQTFDEIHASPELLGKVKDMKNTKNTHIIKKASRIGYALAAALALCFIFSNVITYAATGSSWIEKVVVYINGEKKQVELTHMQDENGNDYYQGTFEVDPDSGMTMELTDGNDTESAAETEFSAINTRLVQEDGKVFLLANDLKIDITEDIKDEACSGTFTLDGVDYTYNITGNPEEYQIGLSTKE